MNGRILLIDNDRASLDRLSALLEEKSYEVIRAMDGEEGLRRFHAELPDLVFLDLMLPRRDGTAVCAEIKSSTHGLTTPVVVLTAAYKTQNKIAFMRTYGVLDFLTKPFAAEKVAALVDWALSPTEGESSIEDPILEEATQSLDDTRAANIADGAMLELITRTWKERFTGLLLARRGRQRKALVFRDGGLVAVRSNLPAERVDRIILSMRLITPSQMAPLRESIQGDPAELMFELSAQGHLNETTVQQVIATQVWTTGVSLLGWQQGIAELRPNEKMGCLSLSQPVHPGRLALTALRRHAWLLDPRMAGLGDADLFRRSGAELAPFEELLLTRREQLMFSLIDGARDVRALREIGNLAQLQVDRALATLAGAGLIEPAAELGEKLEREAAGSTSAASGTHRAGSLLSQPLVHLFGTLTRERATGVLRVETAHHLQFHFVAGEMTAALSSKGSDRLGQVLLDNRVVSRAVLDTALDLQRGQPDQRLGSLLVDSGEMSLAQLERALKILMLRVLDDAFATSTGSYSFDPEEATAPWVIRIGLKTYEVLRRGVMLLPEDVLVRRWQTTADRKVLIATEVGPSDELQSEERELLEAIQPEGAAEDLPGYHLPGSPILRTVEFLVAAGLLSIASRPCETTDDDITIEIDENPLPFAVEAVTMLATAPLPPPTTPPPVAASSTSADRATAAALELLRTTLLSDKRETEERVRDLCERLGGMAERVRQLEAENERLRTRRLTPSSAVTQPASPLRAATELADSTAPKAAPSKRASRTKNPSTPVKKVRAKVAAKARGSDRATRKKTATQPASEEPANQGESAAVPEARELVSAGTK